MPLTALHIGAPEWFTPKRYEKEADPPGFLVIGLNGSQQAEIMPEVNFGAGDAMTFTAVGIRKLFQFGLKDWRNVIDADGRAIEYSHLSALEVQNLLPITDQIALASEIFSRSFLSAPDKKK